jgi:predicted O-linked N-acetylglucosamine transferase (SPINDLY family)
LSKNNESLQELVQAGQQYYLAKNYPAAVSYLEKALELAPDHPGLLTNLAAACLAEGQFQKTIEFAARSSGIDPDNFGAWLNLGLAHYSVRQYAEAAEALEQARRIDPGHLPAMRKLAAASFHSGKAHRSVQKLLNEVLEHSPGDREIRALLADSLIQNAETSAGLREFEQLLAGGDEISVHRLSQLHSSYLLALYYEPDTQSKKIREATEQWVSAYSMKHCERQGSDRSGKLRIGWLSPRFAAGPVANFLLPVLEKIDRSNSGHILYSAFPHKGPVNERFRQLADDWRNLDGKSADDVARAISSDRLDILVDLAGHAPGGQLRALSQKPAPVQVSWLDSFASSGLAEMDAFISDDYLSPVEQTNLFNEQIIRMPGGRLCYRPYENFPEPVETGNQSVVFACYNRLAKINDEVLETWSEIINKLPGSRLELRNSVFDDDQARVYFLERCKNAGLNHEQISLNGSSSYATIMKAYQGVDIALDPFPFSGCTTSCDALWMGVPVITKTGQSLVNRQSAAILNQMDLDEWVAKSREEYVAKACDLANDRARLNEFRTSLRTRMQKVFDPQAFADQMLSQLKALAGKA